MELTQINLEAIDNTDELIAIASHAGKVMAKVDQAVASYSTLDNFPKFTAIKEADGLIHLTINTNEPITVSPGDWNAAMIHLRDVYFPGVKAYAEGLQKAAILKANTILNAE